MKWYENHSNVCALARWLAGNGEWENIGDTELPNGKVVEDDPANRLIYFFEKPWKWNSEWEEFQKEKTKSLIT